MMFGGGPRDEEILEARWKKNTGWIRTRTFWWHRCEDFKTIIWPFTIAYRNETFHSRPSVKEGLIVMWRAASTHTYLKLQGRA